MMLHGQVLYSLLNEIEPVDFKELAGLEKDQKLQTKHYAVICIEKVLSIALKNNWGLCKSNGVMWVFNGQYWQQIDKNELQSFLGMAAEKMGISIFNARYYAFKDDLYKQFLSASIMPKQSSQPNLTLVNLQNGTFQINSDEQLLKPFNREDFLKYQLPFCYDPDSIAPMFESYLNTVLPDKEAQLVLAEYLGYVFIQPTTLKLEKALLLYGSGANGKSVFFEIVNALLGEDNVSSYSLHRVTTSDYTRAKLNGKLLNYASEISGNLDTAVFNQLISGEPVEARLPYGEPFTLTDYAKFIFNCNELPKDVEHNNAYFRRFIIVPFNVTIPHEQQDKKLADRIIKAELSGVFNWVLDGLKRLLMNNGFTDCQLISATVEQYKHEANAVKLFLDHYDYWASETQKIPVPDLYHSYREYCRDNGYSPLNSVNFKRRLENMGINVIRANTGYKAWLQNGQPLPAPQPALI
jgi:putative DNA primase/helicase